MTGNYCLNNMFVDLAHHNVIELYLFKKIRQCMAFKCQMKF